MDGMTPDYVYHTQFGFYRVLDYEENDGIVSATVTNGIKTECWIFKSELSSRIGVVVYLNRAPMRRKISERFTRRDME